MNKADTYFVHATVLGSTGNVGNPVKMVIRFIRKKSAFKSFFNCVSPLIVVSDFGSYKLVIVNMYKVLISICNFREYIFSCFWNNK